MYLHSFSTSAADWSERSNSHPSFFILGKGPWYPLNVRLGALWTFWRGKKCLNITWIRTWDHSARNLVTIPTTLSRPLFSVDFKQKVSCLNYKFCCGFFKSFININFLCFLKPSVCLVVLQNIWKHPEV